MEEIKKMAFRDRMRELIAEQERLQAERSSLEDGYKLEFSPFKKGDRVWYTPSQSSGKTAAPVSGIIEGVRVRDDGSFIFSAVREKRNGEPSKIQLGVGFDAPECFTKREV